jgi:hypothetical protein
MESECSAGAATGRIHSDSLLPTILRPAATVRPAGADAPFQTLGKSSGTIIWQPCASRWEPR